MEKLALLATLHAKPGKEAELEALLKSALALAEEEPATFRWYAFKTGPASCGIFDTFEGEGGREAPLAGEIAKALMAVADDLLAVPPSIEKLEILAVKS